MEEVDNIYINMSITNIISDETVTLVQGVNGICLCEESWISARRISLSESRNLSGSARSTDIPEEKEETGSFSSSHYGNTDIEHPGVNNLLNLPHPI